MRYYPGIMLGLELAMNNDLSSYIVVSDNEDYGSYDLHFTKDELPAAIDTFKRAKDALDECRTKLVALGFDIEEGEFSKY